MDEDTFAQRLQQCGMPLGIALEFALQQFDGLHQCRKIGRAGRQAVQFKKPPRAAGHRPLTGHRPDTSRERLPGERSAHGRRCIFFGVEGMEWSAA